VTMKVLIVDDSVLFAQGLRNLLESCPMEVVGIANDAPQALRMAALLKPELILMDIQMPGLSGIEATRTIKQLFPEIEIVMMTVSSDEENLFEAMTHGASGYLLKGLPPEEFLAHLEAMREGTPPLTPGLAGKLLDELMRRREVPGSGFRSHNNNPLTHRQIQILQLVAEGLPYREIGIRLELSEATIKYHMAEIANRLHVRSRTEILEKAKGYLAGYPSLLPNRISAS